MIVPKIEVCLRVDNECVRIHSWPSLLDESMSDLEYKARLDLIMGSFESFILRRVKEMNRL
jgi:hypothetical protein